MTLTGDVFLNLRTPIYVVRWMSEKSHFRGPFNKYHGKRAETLLKAARQHLYHVYWSLWNQFRFKKSLWVFFKILGNFFNPFFADTKYSLLSRGNFLQHFQLQISQKLKKFSEFFFTFSKFKFSFEHFQKEFDSHGWCIFWTYGLRKTWLDKCLKNFVSEDHSTCNMVNGPKHCWNLNHSTFTIFIYPS